MNKIILPLLAVMLSCVLCACSMQPVENSYSEIVDNIGVSEEQVKAQLKEWTGDYESALNSVAAGYEAGSLEFEEALINALGQAGYTAVDTDNQIDMVNYNRALKFIGAAEKGEEDELQIICVNTGGDCISFCFTTLSGGRVNVRREYFKNDNGNLAMSSDEEFEAYTWKYTDEGYLFFEEYHMPGYDGAKSNTAIRVLPLNKALRELNRKYILPVGYGLNNLFCVEWNGEDFGEIDFYDLFDKFYPVVYKTPRSILESTSMYFLSGSAQHPVAPYAASDNLEEVKLYQIPSDEFEGVICRFLEIKSDELRKYTIYNSDGDFYEYRPRGLYDAEPPVCPFPEVIDCAENDDGTITLTVRAVYPYKNAAEALRHEVVIRRIQDGSFRFISNHILSKSYDGAAPWRVERIVGGE